MWKEFNDKTRNSNINIEREGTLFVKKKNNVFIIKKSSIVKKYFELLCYNLKKPHEYFLIDLSTDLEGLKKNHEIRNF